MNYRVTGHPELVLYFRDRPTPLHFHAGCGEYKISIDILTGVISGKFPKRALKAVIEWYEIYKDVLLEDW